MTSNVLPVQFPAGTRIAVVCFSRAYGGLEMTAIQVADTLRSRGAETMVIAPEGCAVTEESAARRIPVVRLQPRIKYGDLPLAFRLAGLFRSNRIDIIIVLRSQDIHLAALARTIYPSPRVVFYQQMQSGIDKRDLLHRWTHAHVARWLTLTERMRSEVIRHTMMPTDRVAVAPLGRDMKAFRPEEFTSSAARAAFDLPEGRPIIGMLGRLDPQKGQETFIRAVPIVLRTHPKAFFVIAGEETRQEQGFAEVLHELVRDLEIEPPVRFLPPTTEVAKFLAALDIFVMPSHSETYGLVLIEAMAMQKPIVATDAGGVPELVRPGQEALLVFPNSPGHLAIAITQLLSDKALRDRLSKAARERATTVFDANRCLDILVRELVAARPR